MDVLSRRWMIIWPVVAVVSAAALYQVETARHAPPAPPVATVTKAPEPDADVMAAVEDYLARKIGRDDMHLAGAKDSDDGDFPVWIITGDKQTLWSKTDEPLAAGLPEPATGEMTTGAKPVEERELFHLRELVRLGFLTEEEARNLWLRKQTQVWEEGAATATPSEGIIPAANAAPAPAPGPDPNGRSLSLLLAFTALISSILSAAAALAQMNKPVERA